MNNQSYGHSPENMGPGSQVGSGPTFMPNMGVNPPGMPPTLHPVAPGGPKPALVLSLAGVAVLLAIVTAVIIHNNQGLASQQTAPIAAPGLASSPSNPTSAPGLASAPSDPNAAPGLASSPSNPTPAPGLASAPSNPTPSPGLATAPTSPAPSQANATDDVGPYLAALAKIELERQQYDAKITQVNPSSVIAGSISGTGDQTQLNQILALPKAIALKYAGLLQQVQQLSVPPSCKDLQGYYLHALSPFVSLAAATSSVPGSSDVLSKLSLPDELLSDQKVEESFLIAANSALQNVFTSHKAETDLPPAFQITDTEAPGGSGSSGSSLMGPAYHPGQ